MKCTDCNLDGKERKERNEEKIYIGRKWIIYFFTNLYSLEFRILFISMKILKKINKNTKYPPLFAVCTPGHFLAIKFKIYNHNHFNHYVNLFF